MPETVFQNETYRLIAGATLLPDRPGRRPALLLQVKQPGSGAFHYARLYTPSDRDPLTGIASITVAGYKESGSFPKCTIHYRDGAAETLTLSRQPTPEVYVLEKEVQ